MSVKGRNYDGTMGSSKLYQLHTNMIRLEREEFWWKGNFAKFNQKSPKYSNRVRCFKLAELFETEKPN